MRPRVGRDGPVVAHQPVVVGRDDDVERLLIAARTLQVRLDQRLRRCASAGPPGCSR